jgi:hypothetical protein
MRGEIRVTDSSGPPADFDATEHLSDAETAGYLDHDVTPQERRRVETHIDQCTGCRAELVALSRIAHPHASAGSSASRDRRLWWLPAVAAAVVLAAVSLPRLTSTVPRPATPQRSRPITDADGRPHLALVAPADDTTLRGGPLLFRWRTTDADAYRIVLSTETGDPVWKQETGDTSVTLPDSVPLQPGHAYFWRVEAIGKGIVGSTEVRRFQLAR